MISRLSRLSMGFFDPCCCPEASTTAGCLEPTWTDSFGTTLNTTYTVNNPSATTPFTTGGVLVFETTSGSDATMGRSACILNVGETVFMSMKILRASTTETPEKVGVDLHNFQVWGGFVVGGGGQTEWFMGNSVATWRTSGDEPASGDVIKMRIKRTGSTSWEQEFFVNDVSLHSSTGLSFDPGISVETGYNVVIRSNTTGSGWTMDDFTVVESTT